MVAKDKFNLGAFEFGEAASRRQRQIESLGAVVDQVGGKLQRVLQFQSGRRRRAGQRINDADPDLLLRERRPYQPKRTREGKREQMPKTFHHTAPWFIKKSMPARQQSGANGSLKMPPIRDSIDR